MTTAAATAIPVQGFDSNQNGGETDHLAAAVLRALGRSFRNQFSLAPSSAFWMALISFGFWPLWRLGKQFRDYVEFERQQFWHLAEWLRVRRGGEEAARLHAQMNGLRAGDTVLRVLIIGCQVGVIAACINVLGDNFTLDRLLNSTWRFHHPWTRYAPLWKAWTLFLGSAYLLHFARVTAHHASVRRLLGKFNGVLQREGVGAVTLPGMEGGLVYGWWWTAGILSWMGGFWSIPMALAGAAQRRYINGPSAQLRADMLERVRMILHQQRPAVAVPQYAIHSRRCGNNLCRATLRANAKFCPRCGTSAQHMSEVA